MTAMIRRAARHLSKGVIATAVLLVAMPNADVQAQTAEEMAKALQDPLANIAAIMTRTVSASGMDWGVLAAAGVLTIIPGALVIWFVRNHIAKGFALGRV